MKKIYVYLILISPFQIFSTAVFSQNPYTKIWDKRYGGSKNDFLEQVIQTTDGGFLLGGYSQSSAGGDKSQNNRQTGCVACTHDFWIVKTDSSGTLQWDKTYGGTDSDPLAKIQQTSDGGFILGGTSRSNIGWEKSQNTQGIYDYWIVKTDALGNKLWDKDFGGTNLESLTTVLQTSDGGYLLGGYSNSGVGGDKTQPSQGGYDYWIIKTDASGVKQWDKVFGGSLDDDLWDAKQTSDGGYILAGYSYSGAGGDKLQGNWGNVDFWIVRIDSLGNKIWDRDFGGADFDVCASLTIAPDGNYIIAGGTTTDISGDKTQPLWGGAGDWDLWLIKVDTLGNKMWDKDLGGSAYEDELGNISVTSDGGLIIGATSYSFISGNKSENNLGAEQTWMVKTDSSGSYLWDRTIFTTTHEENGYAIETRDGCYLAANQTMSPVGGYKTQPNRDSTNNSYDFWIVKFCDTSSVLPTAAVTTDQFICPGTCTNFLNLSFNATSYQWNFQGASPNSSTAANPSNICYNTPGNFDVTLIATNSVGSDTLLLSNYITVYPFPPPQSILQNGDTLFALAGATSYQWYFNGNPISSATNYFYVATGSGNYNVVTTDGNGCEVEAAINNVIAGLSPTLSEGEGVTAFPNPVEGTLHIISYKPDIPRRAAVGLYGTSGVEISIYNVMGEKIISETVKLNPSEEIDVHALSPGMYSIEINSPGKIVRLKFVKE